MIDSSERFVINYASSKYDKLFPLILKGQLTELNNYYSNKFEERNNDYFMFRDTVICPKINSYEIKNENCIIVNFEDGTFEKAVCNLQEDVFSVERGIEICVFKKVIGGILGLDNKASAREYNKILKFANRSKKRIDKEISEEIEKKQIKLRKKLKEIERKKRRKARKEQAEKEHQIEIQKEAIIRANAEMNNKSNLVVDYEGEDVNK